MEDRLCGLGLSPGLDINCMLLCKTFCYLSNGVTRLGNLQVPLVTGGNGWPRDIYISLTGHTQTEETAHPGPSSNPCHPSL